MFLSSLLSAYAVEQFEPFAKWISVGVIALLLIVGAVIFFIKKPIFGKFVKYAFFGVFLYLLALAVVFFALDIAKNYSDSYAEENWLDKQTLVKFVLVPLLVLACVCLISLAAFGIVSKFATTKKRLVGIIGGTLSALALISACVCIALYYNEKIANDGYYNSDTASVKQLALYILSVVCILAIVGLSLLDKKRFSFTSRSVAYAGVCVAMSFALSYIKLWDMPAGGSVTLVSLLPVMVYSYIFGAKKGVFVGFVYGVLQSVQDPWIIHPAQFFLDYPIAFSCVGLAGLFRRLPIKLPQVKFGLGAILAGAFRFICHTISGVFAFEAYAEGQNTLAYSLVYNSYVFIDIALIIVVGAVLFSSRAFVKTVEQADSK
jgi:thiamine transporter